MRILILGAGAVGGYFGGRLLASGRDVTFLVRPARAEALASLGLTIRSPAGDVRLQNPPTVLASRLSGPADLIILSCKAYDLDDAIAAIAPAVGTETALLPLLNGMHQLDLLAQRFGGDAVLGGVCMISSTLGPAGEILHLNNRHLITFGERVGGTSRRTEAIAGVLGGAGFDVRASSMILQEMWEKWILIAALAGINCLLRADVGEIIAAGGERFSLSLLEECAAIAARAGFAPREAAMQRLRVMFSRRGSHFAASLFRDLQQGRRTEAAHIVGDLLRHAAPDAAPILALAWANLSAYEVHRRNAEAATKTA